MRSSTQARWAALALGIGLGAPAARLGAQEIEPVPIPTRVARSDQVRTTGDVLVRFREGVDPLRRAQILGVTGARIAGVTRGSGFLVVRPRWGASDLDYARLLSRRWEVESAEPDYIAEAANAPQYFNPYQWNLFPAGTMSAHAPSNYGINAPAAWNYSRGAGVIVALLDTGCAYANFGQFHQAPDLAHARIIPGWNFIDNNGYPEDDNGHGTHVATTITAPTDGSSGTAGVAPDCTIMPIKVLGADANGSYSAIAAGIRYAADQGAQIINLSLTGTQPSTLLQDAVQYAALRGSLVVSAAGNENRYGVDYPARYTPCLAVGATRFDGKLASYSNYGWGLSLVAPGGDATQDQNGDGYPDGILAETFDPKKGFDSFGYYFYAGTSMAAPQVSGVAALALSLNPRLGAAGVRTALLSTATDLGPRGWDPTYGYGLVNAMSAVNYARMH